MIGESQAFTVAHGLKCRVKKRTTGARNLNAIGAPGCFQMAKLEGKGLLEIRVRYEEVD